MAKKYICLIIKNNDKHYEVLMDDNLSFKENIDLLKDICDINITDDYYLWYEKNMLKKDIRIKEFCLPQFSRLLIFDVKI